MATLKASISTSLQPCGQASSLCNCGSIEGIWGGRKPSDKECAIAKQLVEQMDFDPVAAAIAVRETAGSGLQHAVEWLLQNLDSLTSLGAALKESATSSESVHETSPAVAPETAPEPAPEPALAAEAARQNRREQLSKAAVPVEFNAIEEDIKQMLQALGFDEDTIQTVLTVLGEHLASMLHSSLDTQAAHQEVMRAAVRTAFAFKLSDEASDAGDSRRS